MWRGYITQTFGDIQETYYRDHKEEQKYTGTAWSRMIVKLFFQYFDEI